MACMHTLTLTHSHTHTLTHKLTEVAAESMVDAMNRHDEGQALRMFHSMMEFMKESATPVKCEMKFPHLLKMADLPPPPPTFFTKRASTHHPNMQTQNDNTRKTSTNECVSILNARSNGLKTSNMRNLHMRHLPYCIYVN